MMDVSLKLELDDRKLFIILNIYNGVIIMAYESCACKIFSTKSKSDLVAGHYYCHALYRRMKRNPNDGYKYTLDEVRAEHSCLVRCMKKNDMEHDSPLKE